MQAVPAISIDVDKVFWRFILRKVTEAIFCKQSRAISTVFVKLNKVKGLGCSFNDECSELCCVLTTACVAGSRQSQLP
jgi:hypothetical protein